MSLSTVLFLFLTHLSVGIAWTLPLVPREAGVKFFRFNAGLAAALLLSAGALRPDFDSIILYKGPRLPDAGGIDLVWDASLSLLGLALAGLTAYWATIGRTLAALRPILLWTALFSGAGALWIQAVVMCWPGGNGAMLALTAASFFTSAALLGGACTSMMLGHWYLILPTMQIGLLQRIVRFHLISLAARVACVAAALALAARGIAPGGGFDLVRYVSSVAGIFFWQRVLFGLAGPAVLGWLTWETAKIRSTQSATGILYVDVFTVIVGEALAKYLLLEISVPL